MRDGAPRPCNTFFFGSITHTFVLCFWNRFLYTFTFLPSVFSWTYTRLLTTHLKQLKVHANGSFVRSGQTHNFDCKCPGRMTPRQQSRQHHEAHTKGPTCNCQNLAGPLYTSGVVQTKWGAKVTYYVKTESMLLSAALYQVRVDQY